MTVCHYLVLCLVVSSRICAAYLKLDQSEQGEQIYTCEIDGIVDQNVHQLHGTLVNCQTPPMDCSIDRDEYLLQSRTNVQCRVPSEDLLFYDDKVCSFRFYYRRSYCFYNSRCYSLTMSCLPVSNPTPLLYALIISAAILIILLFSCIMYCCYECCWRTTALSIPKQEKKIESVRRKSQKLKNQESVRSGNDYVPVKLETSL